MERFIQPTSKNIENYYSIQHDKAFMDLKECFENLFSQYPDRMPNDEGIEKEIKNYQDTKRMKNHKSVVPGTDIDVFEHLKKIQGCDIEKRLIILLDENKNPIDSQIVETGNGCRVKDPEGPMHSILRYILSHPDAKYFIDAHNHPHCVHASPSIPDTIQQARYRVVGNLIDVFFLNAFIITEFDLYSAVEDENNSSIFNYKFDKELNELMYKDHRVLRSVFTTALCGENIRNY